MTTLARKLFLPRGIRNNNPGNIRRSCVKWAGMHVTQNDDKYARFETPEYGFRALARILRSYESRGINSIREIILTYASSTKHKNEMYIDFVSHCLDIQADVPINFDKQLVALMKAITTFENGALFADFYDDSSIKMGVLMSAA